jgi:hypothetical protein
VHALGNHEQKKIAIQMAKILMGWNDCLYLCFKNIFLKNYFFLFKINIFLNIFKLFDMGMWKIIFKN